MFPTNWRSGHRSNNNSTRQKESNELINLTIFNYILNIVNLQKATGGANAVLVKITNNNQNGIKLVSAPLENLGRIRDEILASPGNQVLS